MHGIIRKHLCHFLFRSSNRVRVRLAAIFRIEVIGVTEGFHILWGMLDSLMQEHLMMRLELPQTNEADVGVATSRMVELP